MNLESLLEVPQPFPRGNPHSEKLWKIEHVDGDERQKLAREVVAEFSEKFEFTAHWGIQSQRLTKSRSENVNLSIILYRGRVAFDKEILIRKFRYPKII